MKALTTLPKPPAINFKIRYSCKYTEPGLASPSSHRPKYRDHQTVDAADKFELKELDIFSTPDQSWLHATPGNDVFGQCFDQNFTDLALLPGNQLVIDPQFLQQLSRHP
jgi:hypothetical protein